MPNMTTPNITISPTHGTLIPGQNFLLNVTVSMPTNAVVNATWSGGLAAVESANQLSSGGANVQGGVAKIITATALAPEVKPIPPTIIAAGLFILLAAIGSLAYKFAKPGGGKAARERKEKKVQETRKMTYAEFKAMEARKRGGKKARKVNTKGKGKGKKSRRRRR